MKPMLSVILPAYNAELYIAAAVESILTQTYKNFELIIINDGSTDKTADIINEYKDSRIQIFTQKNQGLVASLNRGIEAAKGKHITRQDADDVSLPIRLQTQLKEFDKNPKLVVVGSSIGVMDLRGKVMHEHHVLLGNTELKQELLVRSPFAHGSVMMRRDAVLKAGGYQGDEWPAEDYGLWLRLSAYGDFANIDEPLYVYRENPAGVSSLNTKLQLEKVSHIQNKAWQQKRRLISAQKIQLSQYRGLTHGQERIERILGNSAWLSRKALAGFHPLTTFKISASLSTNVVTYRKIAGKIRRRMQS